MRRLAAETAVGLVVFILTIALSAGIARAGTHVVCVTNPYTQLKTCTVVVDDPGTAKSGGGSGSGSPTGCSFDAEAVPCNDPIHGRYGGNGCYIIVANPPDTLIDPAPPPDYVELIVAGKGAIYAKWCLNVAGVQYLFLTSAPDLGPTPGQLALRAFKTLALPNPVPGRSPSGTLADGRPYTLVRVPTWFWTDAVSYRTMSARAAAGAVWARVTVTPSALTFAPGDGGATVSCAGPGRSWLAGRDGQWADAPGGCDYSYPRSTYGDPHGELTATYGIDWTISWTGSGGTSGSLPAVTTTSTSNFAVAEAQAVTTR